MKTLLLSIVILIVLIPPATGADTAKSDCNESIPQLFQRVAPSVVLVSTTTVDPFKLTGKFSVTLGSGFVINREGIVVTNSHFVLGGKSIRVTMQSHQTMDATLLGADPILDIAVLQITPPSDGMTPATLGDSDNIRMGEDVIVIGNPFGFEQTVARGIISGVNRILAVSPMSLKLPLIQTDAAINPGNSGGPLLNRCGQVVGITTSMLADAENVGFAVPINVAKKVLPQLIETGRVIRPWLGIRGKLIAAKKLKKILNLDLVDGILVETIDTESPAERAGLRSGELPVTIAGEEYVFGGDIICSVNGQSPHSHEEYERLLHSLSVGDRLLLGIYRNGQRLEIPLSVDERPVLLEDLPSANLPTFSTSHVRRMEYGSNFFSY